MTVEGMTSPEVSRILRGLADKIESAEAQSVENYSTFEDVSRSDSSIPDLAAKWAPSPSLPHKGMTAAILSARRKRDEVFGAEIFADPAWDMILDLTHSTVEKKRISVTSLCMASAVPPTTALRWIKILSDKGIFDRIADETDKRRHFVELSGKGTAMVADYFRALGDEGVFAL